MELIAAVEPLIPALRRYASAMLRNRDVADDLVQDCLERVITHWGSRRHEEDTRQWVFAIAHNLIVNKLRQDARRGLHIDLADVEESALSAPAPQEHRVRHGELMTALAALPEDQRSVILLVSVEDLTYAEAAKALSIPIGTVMSRLARGRERLQRALEGEGVHAARPQGEVFLRRAK
ncbi:sigma-70 family RNA polymerase sigma factor [Paucibacter sp. PLA-PC-4]|uniref:sigma-70 family RNA polymerase sigma factor n=1 Tax=Paucibacter sp. PLA-PC-4 TaxID=2993655 RepID=UPI00224A9CBC|nr:sigma-70 family RNA polymerase sigma factor [Paucibacter sp. PLA-PC-4]MCX2865642.1 sigma-70 family RNA polymerase sigma factor [Paucibacter sp. PLA-PC-4]